MSQSNGDEDPKPVGLTAALTELRAQLLEAQQASVGQDISFGVGKVEVELTVEMKTTGGGQAGVRFWVVNADAKIDHSRGATHKVKLELIPTGPRGEPLKVANRSAVGPRDAPGDR